MNSKNLNNKRALTITEAADYACVSRGTVQNWITKGILPYEELPGCSTGSYSFRRIRKDDLDKFLNQFYRCKRTELKKRLKDDLLLLPRNA